MVIAALLTGFIGLLVLVIIYLHNMTTVVLNALRQTLLDRMYYESQNRSANEAALLRSLADKWDSIEEKPTILAMRRKFHEAGPSVPAIWMREQANLIEEGSIR